MPNKKINQLTPRTPTLTDLILVGDPATGYSYKATLSAMINFVGGNIQFSSLGGISLTNPTNGQVLTFNGTNWVNQTPAAAPVTSVFGRTGAVVAAEGDYSLNQLSDVTISSPTNGQVLKYNGTAWVNGSDTDTGITSLNGLTATTQTFATGTSGTDFNISSTTSAHTFNLPTASATNRGALSSSDWTTFNAKQNTITLATIGNSGAATFISNTLNIPNYTLAGLGGITLNSLAASSPLSYDSITGIFSIQIANSTQNGYLSSLSFNTFTNKQNAITLTTTGSSGSATFISDTLNIPTYTLSGLGGVPISRTLTINGTSFDLSADRSWTISTGGITSLNGLTASTQTFATGSSGTDFTISSTTSTHTFNIPTASSSNRGLLSSADWSTFNSKQSTITLTTTGSSGSSTLVGATLNIPTYTLAGLGGISLSSLSASAPLSYNSGTGAFSITQASGSTNGFLSSTDWTTFNNKQSTITLTTTGSSGASTFVSNTLNVPNYTLAGLGGVSGSGTTNYVSKWTSSSALGNSQIFDNGTNVGIGLTSPANALHIDKGTGVASYSQFTSGTLTGQLATDGFEVGIDESANAVINQQENLPMLFYTNNTERMRILQGGNVGIGTISPAAILDVNAANNEIRSTGTSSTYTQYNAFIPSGVNMRIGAFATNNGFLGTTTNHPFTIETNNTQRARFFANGNLLIGSGTTDGGYRLDVSGTARVREYLYMVRQDGAATIDALRYVTGGTIDIGTTFRVLGTNQWSANTGTTSYIQNNFGSKVFASQPNQNGSFTINDFQTTSLSPTIPASYNQKVIGSSFTISSTAVNNFFGLDIRATDNSSSIANNVYGVYADATLGTNTSANRWAGYFLGRGHFSQVLAIGTTSPNASALLDVSSTTKGFLPPRMTNAQMVAISSPAAGLVVYDTTNNKLNVYDGTNWVATH